MNRADLQRCEHELVPLVAREGASAFAKLDASAFNESVEAVREAVLDPARSLLERGAASEDLRACVEKTVAELAFWRRVLVRVHGGAFERAAAPTDCLLKYLLS